MYLNNLIGCQIANGLNLLVSSPANDIGVHLYLIIVPEYLHQLRSDVVIALTDEYFVLILLCSGFIVFRFGQSYGLRRWNWLGLWRCTHLRCLDHFIIFECFTLLYYIDRLDIGVTKLCSHLFYPIIGYSQYLYTSLFTFIFIFVFVFVFVLLLVAHLFYFYFLVLAFHWTSFWRWLLLILLLL